MEPQEPVSITEQEIDKRRKKIVELLEKQGKVRVSDLSRFFHISEVTIRNDLTELENAGLLDRVHGGAVNTNRAYYTMEFSERAAQYVPEKQRIARAAAAAVHPGDTVMINSGTTTYYIAKELKGMKGLTVVTNSLAVAQELTSQAAINVILLGGNYNPQYRFTYGEDALQQLRRYRTDKLLLSADGVDSSCGLTTHHYQEADVSRTMLERVNQTIVVADYSKIGRENFTHIAPITCIDRLITNEVADEEELALLREQGVEVQKV